MWFVSYVVFGVPAQRKRRIVMSKIKLVVSFLMDVLFVNFITMTHVMHYLFITMRHVYALLHRTNTIVLVLCNNA